MTFDPEAVMHEQVFSDRTGAMAHMNRWRRLSVFMVSMIGLLSVAFYLGRGRRSMSVSEAGRMSRALSAINSTRDEIMDQLTKDGAFVGGPSNWPECKVDPDDSESCPLSNVTSGAWQTVVPGNGTRCLNGDEFTFHVRKCDEDKLIIYFAGGGACWTGTDNKLREFCEDSNFVSDGIFSDHEDNPFVNYTIVQVRYCSGDAFVGDRVV